MRWNVLSSSLNLGSRSRPRAFRKDSLVILRFTAAALLSQALVACFVYQTPTFLDSWRVLRAPNIPPAP